MGRIKGEPSDDKEMTIDDGFMLLQDILNNMDKDNVSLEDSFKLYNDGIKLVKALHEKLDTAEQKITIVNED